MYTANLIKKTLRTFETLQNRLELNYSTAYAPLAVNVLWREAAIGAGIATAVGAFWKVAVGIRTTSAYKQYYENYAKSVKESSFDQNKLNKKIEEILAAARALKH